MMLWCRMKQMTGIFAALDNVVVTKYEEDRLWGSAAWLLLSLLCYCQNGSHGDYYLYKILCQSGQTYFRWHHGNCHKNESDNLRPRKIFINNHDVPRSVRDRDRQHLWSPTRQKYPSQNSTQIIRLFTTMISACLIYGSLVYVIIAIPKE